MHGKAPNLTLNLLYIEFNMSGSIFSILIRFGSECVKSVSKT